jgi:hypothetical protein
MEGEVVASADGALALFFVQVHGCAVVQWELRERDVDDASVGPDVAEYQALCTATDCSFSDAWYFYRLYGGQVQFDMEGDGGA